MKQIGTGSNLPRSRGMARASLDLIEAMRKIAKVTQPITGRGIGYKLFTRGLIPSMGRSDMQRVYRLLSQAREEGIIPWDWIVDETRELERVSCWDDPAAVCSGRRALVPSRLLEPSAASCRGLVRKGHRARHPQASARRVRGRLPRHARLQQRDKRSARLRKRTTTAGRLSFSTVGDYDPSGLYMSERDLPERLERYGGDHVDLQRIALLKKDVTGLPSFPASDKKKDPRYRWFVENFGLRCWELDAMDPRDLRERVSTEIKELIEPVAWERCARVNRAEQESLRTILAQWSPPEQ